MYSTEILFFFLFLSSFKLNLSQNVSFGKYLWTPIGPNYVKVEMGSRKEEKAKQTRTQIDNYLETSRRDVSTLYINLKKKISKQNPVSIGNLY